MGALGGADEVRCLDGVVAGEQEGDGGDGDAEDADDSPCRHPDREGMAVTAVLSAAAVAEPGGQLGAAGSPAVVGGRSHAESGEQQQDREQRAA